MSTGSAFAIGSIASRTAADTHARTFGFLRAASPGSTGEVRATAGTYATSMRYSSAKPNAAAVQAVVRTSKLHVDRNSLRVAYALTGATGEPTVSRDGLSVRLALAMDSVAPQTFSCDLPDTRSGVGECSALLPASVFESNYEDLVSNQEAHSRKLVDFIGLEWDEKCLEFYKAESPVRTASVTQVREAIYSRSVGRWKSYAELLAPVSALLI